MVSIGRSFNRAHHLLTGLGLGGMDAYVQEFGVAKTHDEFYTNPTILSSFKNYTEAVISRFTNNTQVLAWELANDPRCNSTVSASSSCETTTVTQWHADLATHVRSVDPNHLITSGYASISATRLGGLLTSDSRQESRIFLPDMPQVVL